MPERVPELPEMENSFLAGSYMHHFVQERVAARYNMWCAVV